LRGSFTIMVGESYQVKRVGVHRTSGQHGGN
jgi:hypothetical protein